LAIRGALILHLDISELAFIYVWKLFTPLCADNLYFLFGLVGGLFNVVGG
jgi:hypothetical protein